MRLSAASATHVVSFAYIHEKCHANAIIRNKRWIKRTGPEAKYHRQIWPKNADLENLWQKSADISKLAEILPIYLTVILFLNENPTDFHFILHDIFDSRGTVIYLQVSPIGNTLSHSLYHLTQFQLLDPYYLFSLRDRCILLAILYVS